MLFVESETYETGKRDIKLLGARSSVRPSPYVAVYLLVL